MMIDLWTAVQGLEGSVKDWQAVWTSPDILPLVCTNGHIADAFHRLAGDEMAQTGCCHGMAQDISRACQSLIS
jgi:hypothetical protein